MTAHHYYTKKKRYPQAPFATALNQPPQTPATCHCNYCYPPQTFLEQYSLKLQQVTPFSPASAFPQHLPFISPLFAPTSHQSPSLSLPLVARCQSTTMPPAARASKIDRPPQIFLRSSRSLLQLLQFFGYLLKGERKVEDLVLGINSGHFC